MSSKDISLALDRIYPDVREVPLQVDVPIYIPASDVIISNYEVMGVPGDKKERKSWSYIIVGILFLMFLFLIVVIVYNYFMNVDSDNTSVETTTNNANLGAMVNASEYYTMTGNINRQMVSDSQIILEENDRCNYGYYSIFGAFGNQGDSRECRFQAHSYGYFNVGSFPMTYDKTDIGRHSLSLDYEYRGGVKSREGATYICDHTEGCKGVEYDHRTHQASLIMSDIEGYLSPSSSLTVPSQPSSASSSKVSVPSSSLSVPSSSKASLHSVFFDFSDSKQVYLKKNERPHFMDTVFGYSGIRPLRYYMEDYEQYPDISRDRIRGTNGKVTPGIIRFPTNEKIEMCWVPYRIANYGGLVGEYYDSCNNLIFTDTMKGEYNLPLNLQMYDKMYVVYSL